MKRVIGIAAVLIGILTALAAVAAAALVAMLRRRDPKLIKAFTRLQRDVLNPEMLKTAGTAGQSTGVLETVGRRTGKAYETPISPVKDGDGWSVALVYGPETAWVKNALAAGQAVLRMDGKRHIVDRIEVVPIAQSVIGTDQARLVSVFRIEQAVRMRDAGVIEESPAASPATS